MQNEFPDLLSRVCESNFVLVSNFIVYYDGYNNMYMVINDIYYL